MDAGRIFAVALLGLVSVLSIQGWRNAKLTPETAALAKDHACDLDSSCIVVDDVARMGKADVIRHVYEFKTTKGLMLVTCKRELYFFGAWSCSAEPGQLVEKPF